MKDILIALRQLKILKQAIVPYENLKDCKRQSYNSRLTHISLFYMLSRRNNQSHLNYALLMQPTPSNNAIHGFEVSRFF